MQCKMNVLTPGKSWDGKGNMKSNPRLKKVSVVDLKQLLT